MSGRLEQLARQIRRLRTTASEQARTLQRALHLCLDLAREHAAADSADGDFALLASKGVIDAALGKRLDALVEREYLTDAEVTTEAIIDLDVYMRSLELGKPAEPLPLPVLGTTPKLPPGTHRASVNVSGRVVSVVGRDGRAFVLVDDRPVGQPFDLDSVPMSTHELTRDPDGTIDITWPGVLHLQLTPDFAKVSVLLE